MRKVLSVTGDEFLQPPVALLFILLEQCWHLQAVVQCFDFLHTSVVVAPVTCLRNKHRWN